MKLPHWAMVALTLAGVVLTWLAQQQQLGAIVLPAWAASLVTLLLVVLGALGIGSTSVSPQANLRAARLAKLAATTFVLAFALLAAACTKEQTSAVVTVSLDTGICILNHFSDPPATIAKECGVAAVEDVIKFLDAQHAAMVRASVQPCVADGGAP
jgi:hypothetical protein